MSGRKPASKSPGLDVDVPESQLINHVCERFKEGKIYTRVGSNLIALNPLSNVLNYDDRDFLRYNPWVARTTPMSEPHVFALARDTYRRVTGTLCRRENCSVVAHGMMGSGKTESLRLITRYLCKARALYDFQSTEKYTINIREGEAIRVTRRFFSGWWEGSVPSTDSKAPRKGLFPGNYAKLVGQPAQPYAGADSKLGPAPIEARTMHALAVAEAFGNATSLWNINATRNGLVWAISVDEDGKMVRTTLAMLCTERSRLLPTRVNPEKEKNFHVFHWLLADIAANGSADEKALYRYDVLKCVDGTDVDSAEDATRWAEFAASAAVVGLTEAELDGLRRMLKAIMCLGNISFADAGDNQTVVDGASRAYLVDCARCLGLSLRDLEEALIAAGDDDGDVSQQEQQEFCGALAAQAYEAVCSWVVLALNRQLVTSEATSDSESVAAVARHVLLVDLPGFEYLGEENYIQQLSINFASEMLQDVFEGQYLTRMAELFTGEGAPADLREKLPSDVSSTLDNPSRSTLAVRSLNLIFKILIEESKLVSSSDRGAASRICAMHRRSDAKTRKRMTSSGGQVKMFTVRHYHYELNYTIEGFMNMYSSFSRSKSRMVLERAGNAILKDAFSAKELPEQELFDVMQRATAFRPLNRSSFDSMERKRPPRARDRRARSSRTAQLLGSMSSHSSVTASSNKNQEQCLIRRRQVFLEALTDSLQRTELRYIVCVHPDNERKPLGLHPEQVERQLKVMRVTHLAKLANECLSEAESLTNFLRRHNILLVGTAAVPAVREFVQRVAAACPGGRLPDSARYRLGRRNIFYSHSFRAYSDLYRTVNVVVPAAQRIGELGRTYIMHKRMGPAVELFSTLRAWTEPEPSRPATERKATDLALATALNLVVEDRKKGAILGLEWGLGQKLVSAGTVTARKASIAELSSLLKEVSQLEKVLLDADGESESSSIAERVAKLKNGKVAIARVRALDIVKSGSRLARHLDQLLELCEKLITFLDTHLRSDLDKALQKDTKNPTKKRRTHVESKVAKREATLKALHPDLGGLRGLQEVTDALETASQLRSVEDRLKKALAVSGPDCAALLPLISDAKSLSLPYTGPLLDAAVERVSSSMGAELKLELLRALDNINGALQVDAKSILDATLEAAVSIAFKASKNVQAKIVNVEVELDEETQKLIEFVKVSRKMLSRINIVRNQMLSECEDKAKNVFSQRKLTVLSKLVKEAGPLQDEALKFGSDLKQFSRSKDNGLKFWMGRYYKPLFEEIESIRTKFESRRREKQSRKKRNGGRASSGPGLQPTENFESPYSERLRKLQSDLMKVDCYEDGSTNPAVLLRTIILRRITEMTDISHLIRVALSACSTNPDISTKQQLRMLESFRNIRRMSLSGRDSNSLALSVPNSRQSSLLVPGGVSPNLSMASIDSTAIAPQSLQDSMPSQSLIQRIRYILMKQEHERLSKAAAVARTAHRPKTPRQMFPSTETSEFEVKTEESAQLRLKEAEAKEKARQISQSKLKDFVMNRKAKGKSTLSKPVLVTDTKEEGTGVEILKQGIVQKRGNNNTNYKQRLFKLSLENSDYWLRYYETAVGRGGQTREYKKGEVRLWRGVSLEKNDKSENGFLEFYIFTERRTYHLKAPTAEAESWCAAIGDILIEFSAQNYVQQQKVLTMSEQMLDYVRERRVSALVYDSTSLSSIQTLPSDDGMSFMDGKSSPTDIAVNPLRKSSLDGKAQVDDMESAEMGFSGDRAYANVVAVLRKHGIAGSFGPDGPEGEGNRLWEPFDCEDDPSCLLLEEADGPRDASGSMKVARAGTPSKIVQEMTARGINEGFIRTILCNFPVAMEATELFECLARRYCVPSLPNACADENESHADWRRRVRLAVLLTLHIWLREHPGDFAPDKPLRSATQDFLDAIISGPRAVESSVAYECRALLNAKGPLSRILLNTLDALKGGDVKEVKKFRKIKARIYAEQLTLRHFAIFQCISSREFLKTGWTKPDRHKRAPNIVKLTENFTALSRYAIESILSETDVSKRAALFGKWLKIAHECIELQNFNGAFAIYGGLSNSAIFRLKKTKAQVRPKRVLDLYEEIQEVTTHKKNCKTYRTMLEAAFSSCVPYIGTFQTDLDRTENANESTLMGNISVHKFRARMNLITKVLRFQGQQHVYAKIDIDPVVQAQIEATVKPRNMTARENEAFNRDWYAKSKELEPPQS